MGLFHNGVVCTVVLPVLLVHSCECGENEEKAAKKQDEIQEGMKELSGKCGNIEEEKKAQGKAMKKIHK